VSTPRDIVIGDVHGCTEQLAALLAEVELAPGDRVHLLGDLVDRGPDPAGAVRAARRLLARHPGSSCLMGNHELKLLRRHDRGRGLPPWAAALTAEDWAFLDTLPLYRHLPDHDAVLVHGGFFPAFFEAYERLGPLSPSWRSERHKRGKRLARFVYIRSVDPRGNMVGLGEEGPADVHWTARYDGREGHCFFGHDPQQDPPEPLRAPHATGLDTACAFGGRLTAAILVPGCPPADAELRWVPGLPAELAAT